MSKLLNLLQDGRFHSGQDLGQALGVSRSAVWKQLQLLEADLGLVVHKVRGRGYRLATPVSLLNPEPINAALALLGWDVSTYQILDSTNAQALRTVTQGVSRPLLVLAERQDAGRGRRGRPWVSPYAANLYYSLVLPVHGGIKRLDGLSLVAGMATVQCLRAHGVHSAMLKWPNDVLVQGQKIAGILLELVGDPTEQCHVVLGIGINANMRDTDAIDQQWTSIYLQTQQLVDRSALAISLSDALAQYLGRLDAVGFGALREEWEALHAWQGKAVNLVSGSRVIPGTVLGINDQGALRLHVDGKEETFSGGELSLRLRDDS
ncbi:bifunctional biotin--[acetyl-CoA-carboxylase] ligase/biotin operon repressor BirA [Pseudomonas sp. RIT-PI-S]|uniref:bifunctional biotin--[acetyl-CoA-carboxylase] ligase/biotin operon repressor BirA n=1 Tax=Pseudomonas sp. RIT-PI-S TaxID=3035295 RepID=UPI0021DB00FB|nr:bifunctional biotin--[acetyl-CoA-carboxylase] ligase/biotin operon repressor BirA [Pseudomonas sp. RIT-PI-S]